jgi:hypothetical protein
MAATPGPTSDYAVGMGLWPPCIGARMTGTRIDDAAIEIATAASSAA